MADDKTIGSADTFGSAQVYRREGEYWTIVFDGVTCRLRDVRGLQHLAMLLAHPHEQISALVLDRTGTIPAESPPGELLPLHDTRERARVNVTRAIGAALKRLAAHHPALGRHLAVTIRTGTFCSYTPDPRVPVRWTL